MIRRTPDEWRALAHMTAAEAAEAVGVTVSAAYAASRRIGFRFVSDVPEPTRADDDRIVGALAMLDRGLSERAVSRRLGMPRNQVRIAAGILADA